MLKENPGDTRADLFTFSSPTQPDYECVKFNLAFNASLVPIFRVEELFLNRAEAYARLGALNSALRDINRVTVRRQRDVSAYREASLINYPSQGDVLVHIDLQRKFEFPLEGHRWVDVKRRGGRRLVHEYLGTLHVLDRDDPRYVLPIPRRELDVTTMKPNPSNDYTDTD